MSSDLAIARILLEKAGLFALEAANIASAVSADDETKALAEKIEALGDEIHAKVSGL